MQVKLHSIQPTVSESEPKKDADVKAASDNSSYDKCVGAYLSAKAPNEDGIVSIEKSEQNKIKALVEKYEADFVLAIISDAERHKAMNMAYITSIIKRCEMDGITTAKQFEEETVREQPKPKSKNKRSAEELSWE